MEVQIMLKETIKPSSSTPKHLRNYKLSLLDQLAPSFYIPIILFYPSTPETSFAEKSDRLKKSLSETLTLFYPLSGRVKDIYSIDCNDEGASYTESHVAGNMSMIFQDPQVPRLEKLLPFNPLEINSDEVLLGAQANHFDCGGMVISICISHRIADASAAASFATTWAKVASGTTTTNTEGMIYDCTSIFPPQDTQSFSWDNKLEEKDNMIERFVFHGPKLSSLREKVGNGSFYLGRPSRVETVTAIIWGAVLDVIGEEKDENTDVQVVGMAVDLRKRMIPPVPQLSLGNICQAATSIVECSKNENLIDYNNLVGKIHESIGIMKDEYVRMIHEGGIYFEFMKDYMENPNKMKAFGISSWCKFPFYETDFGWGKPIWVTTTIKLHRSAFLIDTKDGEGIEAMVTLSKDDMTKFQQNPYISSYASFNPIT